MKKTTSKKDKSAIADNTAIVESGKEKKIEISKKEFEAIKDCVVFYTDAFNLLFKLKEKLKEDLQEKQVWATFKETESIIEIDKAGFFHVKSCYHLDHDTNDFFDHDVGFTRIGVAGVIFVYLKNINPLL